MKALIPKNAKNGILSAYKLCVTLNESKNELCFYCIIHQIIRHTIKLIELFSTLLHCFSIL